jgi:hypothetical protein
MEYKAKGNNGKLVWYKFVGGSAVPVEVNNCLLKILLLLGVKYEAYLVVNSLQVYIVINILFCNKKRLYYPILAGFNIH